MITLIIDNLDQNGAKCDVASVHEKYKRLIKAGGYQHGRSSQGFAESIAGGVLNFIPREVNLFHKEMVERLG